MKKPEQIKLSSIITTIKGDVITPEEKKSFILSNNWRFAECKKWSRESLDNMNETVLDKVYRMVKLEALKKTSKNVDTHIDALSLKIMHDLYREIIEKRKQLKSITETYNVFRKNKPSIDETKKLIIEMKNFLNLEK